MMHRRGTILASALLIMISTVKAVAGDIAAIQPIGFSKDGGAFAFEEYGVQDGSGFPYASIRIIDTATGKSLLQSPIDVLVRNERASIDVARREGLEQVAGLMEPYRFTEQPGLLAAFNPITNADGKPYEISYYATASSPPLGHPYRLTLEEIVSPDPTQPCSHWSERKSTFRLKLVLANGRPLDRTVFQSEPVAAANGCITSYRLGGVVTPSEPGHDTHVALILVTQPGFEGNNGRWIAAPFRP